MNLMSANPIQNESTFAEAALEHWRQLGKELRVDVDEFNRRGGSASFLQPQSLEYRIGNREAGLEVRIVADPQGRRAEYEFRRTNDHSAGAPEGGILSIRVGRNGVEFYSSDQPLTPTQARNLLLDPILSLPAA
jgi:hypothetical protein